MARSRFFWSCLEHTLTNQSYFCYLDEGNIPQQCSRKAKITLAVGIVRVHRPVTFLKLGSKYVQYKLGESVCT